MIKRLAKLGISLGLYCWDAIRHAAGRGLGRGSAPQAVVLYYHGVSEAERDAFARQMAMLIRHSQPVHCHAGKLQGGRRHAAVTFDDGFVSVLENAWPILKQGQIPVTLFVPSGWLGMHPGWVKEGRLRARNERIMTPEQLREMAADPLVTIGSHTVTHPRIAELDPQAAARELMRSKAELEMIVNRPVTLFSFPHGSYSERDLSLARAAGYNRVFGIQPDRAFQENGEFVTGRVAVDPGDWAIEFYLKLAGAYRWQARRSGRKAAPHKPAVDLIDAPTADGRPTCT